MLSSLKSTQSSFALDDFRITVRITGSRVLLIHIRATDKPLLFHLGAASGLASRVVEKTIFLNDFHLFL